MTVTWKKIVFNEDSPQFTKLTTTSDIELGNASDTTIHRESAGKVSIEGKILTRMAAQVVAASNSYITTQADLTCDGTDD